MSFGTNNFLCIFQYIQHSPGNSRRGFGIDCAILSCQVSVEYSYLVLPLTFMSYIVSRKLCCDSSGVHQPDIGGLSSGFCSGSCWQRSCHSHGGLWGLPPWILYCLLPGYLSNSKQRVRKLHVLSHKAIHTQTKK